MNGGQWTFLSNHGHVLVSLARDPDTRTRDVAEAVGITERAVQQIVHDLVEQGYVEKMKVGRRNRYTVVRGAHLRHQQVSRVPLGEFLDLLVPPPPLRRDDPRKSNDSHLSRTVLRIGRPLVGWPIGRSDTAAVRRHGQAGRAAREGGGEHHGERSNADAHRWGQPLPL